MNECEAAVYPCASGMVCNNQEGDFECVDIDECTDKVDECGDGYR